MGLFDFLSNILFTQTTGSGGNIVADITLTTLQAIEAERAGTEAKRAARKQAATVRRAAGEEGDLIQLRARRLAGIQRAKQGASGVSGSPVLVVTETLILAFDEIRRTRAAGEDIAQQIEKRGREEARAGDKAALFISLSGAGRFIGRTVR